MSYCATGVQGCAGITMVIKAPHRGRRLSAATLLHELGHVAQGSLGPASVLRFESLLAPTPEDWYFASFNDETWAEAWSFCATRRRYPRRFADNAPYFFGYGFYPTRGQFRATCRLLAREARAAGWSRAVSPDAW